MRTLIELELPNKQTYISQIEPFKSNGIPSNSIIHKQVTGCGITTFEIEYALHHSIIILPNVPVIKGKVEAYNEKYEGTGQEILGVHKGIDADDIKAYLLKDVKYKKILTTPEGFITKVLKAFENQMETLKQDYFLLYDECERIITDVSYRGAIAAPLDLFFEFDNKALVSATTLTFSDERFDSFDHYVIKPLYDYSKQITVINTNNVVTTLKGHLDTLQSEHTCIFINSTNGIHAIAESLNMKAQSKAFCAQESVVKLLEKGYINASSEFDKDHMSKYNFFTSRYFSAVDIELEYKPDVILITDIFFADHSILDPHTEVIQIAGRFRQGINSLTHIANFNPLMKTKTPEEAITYLDGCLDTYEHVVKLFQNSKHEGTSDTLKFFVKHSPIASFYSKGKRNSFMIDNALNEERVKSYYTDKKNLQSAYYSLPLHFELTSIEEGYPVGDDDLYTLKSKQTKKERYRQVAILLERYNAPIGGFLFLSHSSQEQKNILVRKYPLIANAHRWIGLSGLEATDYDAVSINKVIAAAKKIHDIARIAPYVHSAFDQNKTVQESDVFEKLSDIYKEHGIKFKVSATHIRRYFDARRTTEKGQNVYIIGNCLA